MASNNQQENSTGLDTAQIVPLAEKNSFIIPWEEAGSMRFSSNYFERLYAGSVPIKDYRYYHRPVRVSAVRRFEWSIFLAEGNKSRDVGLVVEMLDAGLKVSCDCKKRHTKLCDFAIIGLYDRFEHSDMFFENLFVKQVDDLPESQHRFFQFGVYHSYGHGRKVYLKNHEQFGQVYTYFDHQPLEAALKKNESERLWTAPHRAAPPKFMYVVPTERQVDGLPFLIPFIIDRKLNYLREEAVDAMPNIAESDVLKVDLCRKILRYSNILENEADPSDGHHVLDDEAGDRGKRIVLNDQAKSIRKEQLISAWRDLLEKSGQVFPVTFVNRNYTRINLEHIKCPSNFNARKRNVLLAGEDLRLRLHLQEQSDHLLLSLIVSYKGEELNCCVSECSSHFFFINLDDNTCLFVDHPEKEFLLRSFSGLSNKITVLQKDYSSFFDDLLVPLSRLLHISIDPSKKASVFVEKTVHMPAQFKVVVENEGETYLNFGLKYILNETEECEIASGGNLILKSDAGCCYYIERDLAAENEFNAFVEAQSSHFETGKNKAVKRLDTAYCDRNWLYEFTKKCTVKGYKTFLNKIPKGKSYYPHQLKWEVLDVRQENNLFSIHIVFRFDTFKFLPGDFEENMRNSCGSINLGDQSYGYIKASDRALFEPLFTYGTVEGACIQLTSAQLLSFQTQLGTIDPKIIQGSIRQRREKLERINEIPLLETPESVNALLRPYQQTGYSWMAFLNEFQWGGILADDMGLGKTLQAITLLEYFYQNNPQADPSIIVVPNSLLFNWESEFKKFAPDRKLCIYHGRNRREDVQMSKGTIVVTTYGTAMSDADLLQEQLFSYMILDESQAVKNRNSKRFKTLYALNTCYRIAMTGTPVENEIADLYAQMSMVNPGFFGNYRNFNSMFGNKKEDEVPRDKIEQLQKMIAPFLLRRTKKQVALDLPEKTETILYLDMLPEQRKIYDTYRKRFKADIEENLNSDDSAKSKFIALEALMKLRNICNSPQLVKGSDYQADSIKLDYIDQILREVIPGHKVLLFSFFTSMLKLVEDRIRQRGIAAVRLDGKLSREQRQLAVDTFQQDDACRVFLISLKAGGTGLNLTAADYVYILDPWWNPAAEAQAIDRCYRIGQDKHVMAYKMVCRDSVEERILALQDHKKRMAEGLILDEANLMKSISKEELLKLFE